MGVLDIGHRQRPACAVPGIRAAFLVFRLLEVGQDIVIAPAGIAEVFPIVEIFALAANVDQSVNRTRSAEHAPARHLDTPTLHARFGIGLEHPVDVFVEHGFAKAERNMDPRIAIAAAGFQQQHAMPAGFGQAIRQYATGGAGADDDVVVVIGGAHILLPVRGAAACR